MRACTWACAAALLMPPMVGWAVDAGSFAGSWSGTMTARNGVEVHVDLALEGERGTWRMSMPGAKARARQNPCLERDLPVVVVSRTEADLSFDVQGAQVVKGCIDHRASLSSPDGRTLQGQLSDGRGLVFTRR